MVVNLRTLIAPELYQIIRKQLTKRERPKSALNIRLKIRIFQNNAEDVFMKNAASSLVKRNIVRIKRQKNQI